MQSEWLNPFQFPAADDDDDDGGDDDDDDDSFCKYYASSI